jgi:hypothetical protein
LLLSDVSGFGRGYVYGVRFRTSSGCFEVSRFGLFVVLLRFFWNLREDEEDSRRKKVRQKINFVNILLNFILLNNYYYF